MSTKSTHPTGSFSKEDLTVYLNNEPILILNGGLAERQGLTKEDITRIKELHIERQHLERLMKGSSRQEDINYLFAEWTKGQFALQRAWKFPEDANWHPSHRLHHCDCSKLDNDDRLGTPYRIVTKGCPIHDPI